MSQTVTRRAARDEVIRQFQRERFRLIAYIRALTGRLETAEEVFQEVSVVVLQKAGEFLPDHDLQAWCRGIARHVILRHRESARRLRTFEDDRLLDRIDAAFEENAERDLVDSRRGVLRECMEGLAPAARQVVDLRYSEGLSLREIAGRMDKSPGAIQVALSRVRKWLSDCVARRSP